MLKRVTSMNQTNMTSREIITRVIERKDAPRIGFNFNYPYQNDFRWQGIAAFENHYERYSTWGRYPEVLAKVPGFNGEVRVDALGNICGRVGKDHNGECIKGVLQDDWELLDSFEFPEFDQAKIENQIYSCAATDGKDGAIFLTHYDDVDEAPAEEVCLKVKGLNAPKGVRAEYYLVDAQHDNKLIREEKFTSGEFTVYLPMKLFDICLIKLVAME